MPGADLRFVSGDVAPVHAQMVEAAAGRNVWVVGGGDLVGQFADVGLLDDLILGVGSVFLGAGAPLLPRRITPPRLRLVSATAHGEDFATLRYELVGAAPDSQRGVTRLSGARPCSRLRRRPARCRRRGGRRR